MISKNRPGTVINDFMEARRKVDLWADQIVDVTLYSASRSSGAPPRAASRQPARDVSGFWILMFF